MAAPDVVKKYFPNGPPESWKKLFPNGPPKELFEGGKPGEMPPKLKELFKDGVPEDLQIFKDGPPADLLEYLREKRGQL